MNNSRILTIKNAKFSGYYFYTNSNIRGDFQICISVPLIYFCAHDRDSYCLQTEKDFTFLKKIEDHLHKLEKAVVQNGAPQYSACNISYIAFAIISDLKVLFPVCQVTSESGKICTSIHNFKVFLIVLHNSAKGSG